MTAESSDRWAIETHDLTKRYGHVAAVDGVDLHVHAGRVLAFLGPNGAGKTTTLRMLMGLIRPSEGHATVLGRDVWDDRESIHRHVGYLPGDFVAYPDLTGDEYLRLLADLRGTADSRAIEALSDRFRLDLSRPIGHLSHGNRRKVGLVQAFMHEPDILLLDEPTGGLDPLIQREFAALIAETRDEGRTVVVSSHVLAEVDSIADDVAVIRDGRLVVVDSIAALKAKVRSRLVLTFESDPPAEGLRRLEHVDEVIVSGRTAEVRTAGSLSDVFRVAAPFGIEAATSHEADLEDVFMTYFSDA